MITQAKHSLKDYKKNKEHINKLAEKISKTHPVLYKQEIVRYSVCGFQLIAAGIIYHPKLNERIDPCTTYIINQIRHEPIDHEDNLKHVFMDRGLKGLLSHVQAIPIYAQKQKRMYPELYNNE